jgi:hypothetical protein
VASNNALKLAASNVFTWIHDDIIKELKSDLESIHRKEADTLAAIRKATKLFETISYQRQAKALPGRSLWIAEQCHQPYITTISPE